MLSFLGCRESTRLWVEIPGASGLWFTVCKRRQNLGGIQGVVGGVL